MAIVKATYTKNRKAAKASIRYIQHRPGHEQQSLYRTLFTAEGKIERDAAYTLVDTAKKGSVFFRFVISPDPAREDSRHDLLLREVTEQTMQTLGDRLASPVAWVASIHADHTPHRHVHVLAVVQGKLFTQDFTALRERATAACQEQRREREYSLRLEERQAERDQAQRGAEGAGYGR